LIRLTVLTQCLRVTDRQTDRRTDILRHNYLCQIELRTLVLLLWLQLFVVDNCIDDWRIAMSVRRVLQLTLELVICSVHPPPGAFYFEWQPVYDDNDSPPSRIVPVDALLALPMFLRLYLVCRQVLLIYKMGLLWCFPAVPVCRNRSMRLSSKNPKA